MVAFSFSTGTQVCEAGFHISLGIGHRLYNLLLQDCQQLDLKLAFTEEDCSGDASHAASKLLRKAQSLDKEIDHLAESVQRHQAAYDFIVAFGKSETELQQLSDLISSVQQDISDKVTESWKLFIDYVGLSDAKIDALLYVHADQYLGLDAVLILLHIPLVYSSQLLYRWSL